jgi:hypothetical protein
MTIYKIINNMMNYAQTCVDHEESNNIAYIANKLAHQGELFEPKLTQKELIIVQQFMD